MNKSNIRFLSLASLSMFVALTPLACGDDDDSGNPGGAGKGGSKTTGGSAGKPGDSGADSGGSAGSDRGGSSGTGTGGTTAGGGDEGGAGAGGEGGAPVAAKARLRVVHASPNAPDVDVYVKGATTAAVKGVAYGRATTFIEVDAGSIAFDLRTAGANANTAPAFTSEDIEVEGDADYTLVAAGDFADAENEETRFRILPLEHDFEAAADGVALARVVHATSAWETVDFDVVGSPDVDLPGLDRFASESNFAIPSGATVDVDFLNADGVLSQLVLPKQTQKTELFVIATGNPGLPFRAPANGFALLVVDQDGKTSWVKENPWLHLVHASDIGTVDVYETTHANVKLADDVAAESLVGFQLPASTSGFTIKAVDDAAPNGSASGLASGPTSTIKAGEHYLSYIAGTSIQLVPEQFDLEQTTKVLLRGVHAAKAGTIPASVDFGRVVSDAISEALLVGVAPTEASAEAGFAINPGNLVLGAAATSTTTPLFASTTLNSTRAPVAGERDFVLLTGTAVAAKLWVVDTSVPGWSIR